MKPKDDDSHGKTAKELAAEYRRKQEKALNRPSAWVETEIMGRQRVSRKKKSREWVTLFQRSGISLQFNPAYLDFRLWLFSEYGRVGLNLDLEKRNNLLRALGLYRFLISNVASHGVPLVAPSQVRNRVKLSSGDKKRFSTAVNRYITGKRSKK